MDASPLYTEDAAGAPGIITLKSAGNNYSYIDNECFIESYVDQDAAIINATTPGEPLPDPVYISIRTESFTTNAPARAAYESIKQHAKDVSFASGIGDEAFFARSSDLENPLVFRKGRYIVEISPRTHLKNAVAE